MRKSRLKRIDWNTLIDFIRTSIIPVLATAAVAYFWAIYHKDGYWWWIILVGIIVVGHYWAYYVKNEIQIKRGK